MRKALLACSILCGFLTTRAQWVTIPDAHFVNWLHVNVPGAMNGNQMDTTHTQVINLTNMYVSNDTIADLTGVQYFDALTWLDCANYGATSLDFNTLSTLPRLPNHLQQLWCWRNKITSLPALPATLTNLACSDNLLSSLPSLPSGLTSLQVSGNLLTTFPPLPSGITELQCDHNQLTSLPQSLPNITQFTCDHNQLTNLPSLPSLSWPLFDCSYNLLGSFPPLPSIVTSIKCNNNLLTSLPALPPGLTELYCFQNKLDSLPLLPSTITSLNCDTNLLTSLPPLPINLIYLNCNQNLLVSLPVLPDTLLALQCSRNQLTTINLPMQGRLSGIDCSYNPLSAFPAVPPTVTDIICDSVNGNTPTMLPPGLGWYRCRYNQLTTFPPLPTTLHTLICSDNLLSALPSFPTNLQGLICSNNALLSLPPIPSGMQYLDCSNNQLVCLPTLPDNILSLDVSNNAFTCVPNYVWAMDMNTLGFPLCAPGNAHSCPVTSSCKPVTFFDLEKDSVLNSTYHVNVIYSGNVTNARWDWGDNTSSAGMYPTHTYSMPGWYNVCVTAFASCGDSANYCLMDTLFRTSASIVQLDVRNNGQEFKSEPLVNKMYPNPVSESFYIECTDPGHVSMINIYGMSVLDHELDTGMNIIDVRYLASGVYFVAIKTESNYTMSRIVIRH